MSGNLPSKPGPEWIRPAHAKRDFGLDETVLMRSALKGNVRHLCDPSGSVRFHRADVERLAAWNRA